MGSCSLPALAHPALCQRVVRVHGCYLQQHGAVRAPQPCLKLRLRQTCACTARWVGSGTVELRQHPLRHAAYTSQRGMLTKGVRPRMQRAA